MTDEIKAQRDRNRGVRAQALLENELLKEAFTELEASYIQAWRATHVDQTAGREKLFLAINVLGKVQQHLIAVISDGKLADRELKDLESVAEARRR